MPILYISGNHEIMQGRDLVLKEVEKTNIKHIGNKLYGCCDLNFVGVDYEYNLRRGLTDCASRKKF